MGLGNSRWVGGVGGVVRRNAFTPLRAGRALRAGAPLALLPQLEPLESRAYLTVTLGPASDFPGVTSPAGIAVADVNGDGVADVELVGINPTTNLHSVAVSLAGATPVFYDLPADNSAQDIVTGDFNGDGDTDIAVTDPVDATVNVLLGNGDGTFQTPLTTSYGTAQAIGSTATAWLVTADFNGDSKADLAVTDSADHQISILLGNGDGTFTLAAPITSTEASFDPQHIVTADFNGDGFADLAYNDGTAAQVNVALGNNNGTFGAPTGVALDGAVQGLVAGDVNADGNLDIVASVTSGTGSGAVDVLLNIAGVFSAAVPQSTTFADPGPVGIGDIDGDGLADIVTMNSSGTLDLFLGAGSGAFGTAIESQATTGSPQALVIDDVSGDGKGDILFSEVNSAIANGGGFGLVLGPSSPEVSATIAGVLPATAISGQKTSISQTVKLTNISGAPVPTGVNISVALSTDASFSSDDTAIDSVTVKGKLGIGKSKSQRLKIAGVPAGLTPGNYFVVVQATDPSGGTATTSSSATIEVLAPQVDVSGSFKKAPTTAKPGKHLAASITLTNDGNIPLTGVVPIDVDTSTVNTLDETAVQVLSFSKKVNLKPGKSITIQLARLIAPAAAGAYYLIVQLDPGDTLGDVNTQNNIFATGAQIVVS